MPAMPKQLTETGPSLVARKLAELKPEWIATAHPRYGMGFRFLCPDHEDHHIEVWFENPCDGDAPLSLAERAERRVPRLYHRLGTHIEQLTLYDSARHEEPIDLRPHWRGWIHEGAVWNSLRLAVI